MFKDVVIVCVFLRNRVFRLRQKYPLANFLILLFLAYLSEQSWWISPSINSTLSSIKTWTVPPYSFARDVDIDCGYFCFKRKTRFLRNTHTMTTSLTLVYVTNTTRLYRDEKEKEILT